MNLLLLAALAAPAADNAPGWHKDYAAARAEARRLNRPLLVVFR